MKYTTEITVDLPINEFVEKLDNPENMKHWMRNFIRYQQISGEPGQEGSKMTLTFKRGKGEMSMVETIIKRNFPDEFHGSYETKGVYNLQKNYFYPINESQTKWVSETEFQFSNFGLKLMGFLMPGAFKKQLLQYAKDFKNFAENGTSLAE